MGKSASLNQKRMWGNNPRSKYGNAKATVQGKTYHSRLEAGDALSLKALESSGEISDLQEQVRYRIFHEGEHIVDSIVDFRFVFNGVTVWYETKGFVTDVYRVKRRLIEAEMKGKTDEVYVVNWVPLMEWMRGRTRTRKG